MTRRRHRDRPRLRSLIPCLCLATLTFGIVADATAAAIVVREISSFSGRTAIGTVTPFQHVNDRTSDYASPTGLTGQTSSQIVVDVGPPPPTGSGPTYQIRTRAQQGSNLVSRASVQWQATTNVSGSVEYGYSWATTAAFIEVVNDLPVPDRVFYDFTLSNLLVEIDSMYGAGPNPRIEAPTAAGGGNIYRAEPCAYADSGTICDSVVPQTSASLARIDFAIYDESSALDILDFTPLEQTLNPAVYRAYMEIYQSDDGDKTTWTPDFQGLTVTPETLCSGQGDSFFCYGYRMTGAGQSGFLDLGTLQPGESRELWIYSRAMVAGSAFQEGEGTARIGDPGGVSGGISGSVRSGGAQPPPVQVPVPASLPLLAMGLAALGLVGSRRRR